MAYSCDHVTSAGNRRSAFERADMASFRRHLHRVTASVCSFLPTLARALETKLKASTGRYSTQPEDLSWLTIQTTVNVPVAKAFSWPFFCWARLSSGLSISARRRQPRAMLCKTALRPLPQTVKLRLRQTNFSLNDISNGSGLAIAAVLLSALVIRSRKSCPC